MTKKVNEDLKQIAEVLVTHTALGRRQARARARELLDERGDDLGLVLHLL